MHSIASKRREFFLVFGVENKLSIYVCCAEDVEVERLIAVVTCENGVACFIIDNLNQFLNALIVVCELRAVSECVRVALWC